MAEPTVTLWLPLELLLPALANFSRLYCSITKFAEHYKSTVGDLALELKQMKRMIERKTADNTKPVFGENTSTLLRPVASGGQGGLSPPPIQ